MSDVDLNLKRIPNVSKILPKTKRFDNDDNSVGIVPRNPPCCSASRLNSTHSFNSDGIVPMSPLFSVKGNALLLQNFSR
jgi:hypothetical protein